ncbi:MAG: hypothetical protein Q7R79_00730 [bacterium]|nr:hypothetical protein [bacterium]
MGKESISSFVFDDLAKKLKKPSPSPFRSKNEGSLRGAIELDKTWRTKDEFVKNVVALPPRMKGVLFLRPIPLSKEESTVGKLVKEFRKTYGLIYNAPETSEALSVNIPHAQRILRKLIDIFEKKDASKKEKP